jgi:hypothetical protein
MNPNQFDLDEEYYPELPVEVASQMKGWVVKDFVVLAVEVLLVHMTAVHSSLDFAVRMRIAVVDVGQVMPAWML